MVDQHALQAALRDFAHTLVRRYEIGDVLYRLSDDVTTVLGIAGSGVSLLEEGELTFVTATSDAIEQVERLQDQFLEGPCKDASVTAGVVVVDDLRSEVDRWPKFAPAAVDHGLPAVLGIPMHLEGTTIGALNVYDDRPRSWSSDEIAATQLLADMATAYIVMVGQLRTAEQLAGQLQHALDSRVVIEQAKGVLASNHDVDVSTAFERLRRHARNRLDRVIRTDLTGEAPADRRLKWRTDARARQRLEDELFGKRILFTNRNAWPRAEVVAGYRSQSDCEDGFRQMKDPKVVSFSPMFHWTEQKIHVHTFYCALALQIAHLMRRHAHHAGLDLSVRRLLDHLAAIQETVLLYQAERGRPRARRMITDTDATGQLLYDLFDLDRYAPRR